MNFDDFDEYDEGWIWLAPGELKEIQREKNRLTNALLDNAATARTPAPPAPRSR